jgi:hypothetical protein
MLRARTACPFIVIALVGAWSASAAASPANSPPAEAGNPSCSGLIIAEFNHDTTNPFENPNSSAGPGPFFHEDTHQAIEELAREPNC